MLKWISVILFAFVIQAKAQVTNLEFMTIEQLLELKPVIVEKAIPLRKVLYIGDSHSVGAFGEHLYNLIQTTKPVRVVSVGSWGSSPNNYLFGYPTYYRLMLRDGDKREMHESDPKHDQLYATPTFDSLVSELKPTHVVVALGANLVTTKNDKQHRDNNYNEQTTRQLVDKIKAINAKCIWVGPPDAPKYFEAGSLEETYQMLYRVMQEKGCTFVDSRKFITYPDSGGDGLHFDYVKHSYSKELKKYASGEEMAGYWAEQVFSQLKKELEQ